CKFKEVICRSCNKKGHLEKVCRKRKTPSCQAPSRQNPSRPVLSLFEKEKCPIKIPVTIEGKADATFELDTGSAISTIPLSRFVKVFEDTKRHPSNITVQTASQHIVVPNSKVFVRVKCYDEEKVLPLYLMNKDSFPMLFGRSWLEEIKLPW